MTDRFRIDSDTMGEVRVPADAHYGALTQRAADNFPISGLRFPRRFLRALGLVKAAAVIVNRDLGLLPAELAAAIESAANEVADGRWDSQFIVDVFQTGSGTSTNMNVNEVIASRANEILGGQRGDMRPVRPNDDVNRGQSSNDVIPTTIHLAALSSLDEELLPAMERLTQGLQAKAHEFRNVLKTGRTHLQDAVPMMLGQEFEAWASQIRHGIIRVRSARLHLLELPIGGTALGTGLNTHPEFGQRMCAALAAAASVAVRRADNSFEAMSCRDAIVEASAALRTVAVSLIKVAGDIRLLASGPRTGIGELHLPELQPGSSIMPGKVNPVIPEMMIQVCGQVIGNDAAILVGGLMGQLELNVMMPLMAHNLLQSISILAAGCRTLNDRCVSSGPEMPGRPENVHGITANVDRCKALVESSLMPVTALVPRIGYQAAAAIAHEASQSGRTIREIVAELQMFSAEELNSLLNLTEMARQKDLELQKGKQGRADETSEFPPRL